ncbi:hypothetical protein vBSflM004_122 [Shigella phage vB_SflM_004]|nr:hypothetical protein vBSflM004_122 [Shigella phage vB_SflM_004]
MIRTPVKPFGFNTLEEFTKSLLKGFYNEQPVTVIKSDLSELLDMVIKATSEKEPEQEPKKKDKKASSKKDKESVEE